MAQMSSRSARARAAMELKLTILSALSKLSDRDTQHMAVEELHRIAENLSPDTLPVFLSCILDVGSDHKLPARKESARILSALATLHGEILSPHIPKIMPYLIRRLKDTDSQIRDVCVDTMGSLAARVPVAAENQQGGGFLAVYTKPLFDAMGEQTKSVQVGAAMCLGKVIESAPNLSPACVHRLAPRIVKVLSSPGFMAKAALLSAIGSLSRVVKDSGEENLIQLVPCVHEALQSNDWTARKAAAETLAVVASPGLSKMKPSTLGMLDSYRFDKVKPVRDAVTCAIQVWKTVPDPEADCSYRIKRISSPSDEMPSFSRCWKEPDAENDPSTADNEHAESVTSDDKGSSKSRRKAPTLSDMKPNPEFFRKLESKITDDWQVEVAVPRVPGTEDSRGSVESEKDYVSAEATPGESGEVDNSSRRSRTPVESEAPCSDAACVPEPDVQISTLTIKASMEETATWLDEAREGQKEKHWGVTAAGVAAAVNEHGISGSDWMLIQRQICQLERGQTELLEMLQDFMCTCQENMLSLQDRVQRLEKSVENIEKASGRSSGGSRHLSSFEFSARNRLTGGDAREPDAFPNRPFRLSEYDERFSVHSDSRSGRESPYGNQEFLNGSRRVAQNASNSFLFGAARPQQVDDDVDNQAPIARRAWDRGSGSASVRHGEGPSARSVWRASKDEATLQAIRGAAGEELMAGSESEKAPEILLESKDVEHKPQQPSWLFWSRAMENLHGGDVDSAYEEALSAEDDLLLVRMMNQTGPAFDHFSGSTALSMFRALIQILHQQHFLDAAFPWLEQAAELMKTKGPEGFNLSPDAKRELVSTLHETSALDFPERWMGNAVAKLALQFATAWSIDLLHQGD